MIGVIGDTVQLAKPAFAGDRASGMWYNARSKGEYGYQLERNIFRMTDLLNKARIYEEEREKSIPFESRPFFHFTPRAGWMNS